MEPIVVRGVVLGKGRPKIIVPVLGETVERLLQEAEQVKTIPADLVEWRVDWFDRFGDRTALLEAAAALRERLGEMPLLATFRTAREGGEKAIAPEEYRQQVETLAASSLIDLMDVEAFFGESLVRALIAFCHAEGVKVVLSNHDFAKTPDKEELMARLAYMEALGGDIAKLAVMPRTPGDVLTLLSATWERSQEAQKPVVTMSMGGLGAVSRLTGELFGSALTFGTAARSSAPGQIPVEKLAQVLNLLHQPE